LTIAFLFDFKGL